MHKGYRKSEKRFGFELPRAETVVELLDTKLTIAIVLFAALGAAYYVLPTIVKQYEIISSALQSVTGT